MPYHFSSWSSLPRVILLVYVVDKNWFRFCSMQRTQCQCAVWFSLGLCSEFGSLFDLGFYSALMVWGETAIHMAICERSGMLALKIHE